MAGMAETRFARLGGDRIALPVVGPVVKRRQIELQTKDVAVPGWRPRWTEAGVKVERPTGRTTLTPARTVAQSGRNGNGSGHRRP
jgi:hypothetical protein